MPQFPPQRLIWVVCELLAYFTMCTVIPCEMGDATSEITQAVPIPYQQTPELLRDSTCGKGTGDAPGCHPGPRDGPWIYLLFSSRGRERPIEAISAGKSAQKQHTCHISHQLESTQRSATPPHTDSMTPGLPSLAGHLCQKQGAEPPNH